MNDGFDNFMAFLIYGSWIFPGFVGWWYFGGILWLVWFFLPLGLMAVLARSIFSPVHEEIPRDLWSYRFLCSVVPCGLMKYRINLCDIPERTIVALWGWFFKVVWNMCYLPVKVIAVPVLVIIGLLFAQRFDSGYYWENKYPELVYSFESYRKWPKIAGMRAVPLGVILTCGCCYLVLAAGYLLGAGILRALSVGLSDLESGLMEIGAPISATAVMYVAAASVLLIVLYCYFTSRRFREDKAFLADVRESFQKKYCLVKEVDRQS